jgi:hypothetical protein
LRRHVRDLVDFVAHQEVRDERPTLTLPSGSNARAKCVL